MRRVRDAKKIASPTSTRRTAIYIGFLTVRYNRLDTNSVGGSMGAGVPLPIAAKSQAVQI